MEVLLTFVLGQVVPGVIDLINRKVTSSKARFIVSVVFCLLLGVIASIGDVTTLFHDPSVSTVIKIFQSGTIIFTSSQIAYKTYYENSTMQAKIRNPLL